VPPPDIEVRTVTVKVPAVIFEALREVSYLQRRTKASLMLEGILAVLAKHGKRVSLPA
jgi:hypothetical protein